MKEARIDPLADNTASSSSSLPITSSEKGHDETALILRKQGQSLSDQYLTRWQLYLTVTGLMLGIFLATMEVSIVTTALVDITNELQAFSDSSWILNAYLLTFTGILVIWAQFSHVLGRKLFICLAYLIFITFSGACAGAKTPMQLIVLRAFQGIGGSGVFNLSMVIQAEIVRPEEFPKYSSLTVIAYTLSYGLGPLIGGGISSVTTWRWVFWLNIPAATIPLIIITIALPKNFPHQYAGRQSRRHGLFSMMRRLDPLGAILFLGLSIMLVAALQGAGITWAWSSPASICLFIFASISTICFIFWERFISLHRKDTVPVLTWEFATRKCLGMFMGFFLVSTPLTSTMVQIPERHQILNNLSPFDAGVRFLPFILTMSIVSFITSLIMAKVHIKHAYVLFVGIAFQIAGAVLFILLPDSMGISPIEYGSQFLLAIGLGMNNIVLIIAAPAMVKKPLIASAMGANMQFRYLGGAVGLGVVTVVFNYSLRSRLASVLSPDDVRNVLESTSFVHQLPLSLQQDLQSMFSESFALEWKTLLCFICAEFPATLMML